MTYTNFRILLFLLLLFFSATPYCSPAIALAGGMFFSLSLGNPWPGKTPRAGKYLLQYSVIGLGFGVAALDIWNTGRLAVVYTLIGIFLTVLIGQGIGRLLGTNPQTSSLISFGTAICGGSAIAAMAPVLKAKDEDIAVSLATIFCLNATALLLFPPLGHYFGLSQRQFGLWAALAIHDTSSVVGAASAFGFGALAIGTTIKLARAVWIGPCVLATSLLTKTKSRAPFPLFILGFLAAALLRSLLPDSIAWWDKLAVVARQGLVVTLFLIGMGLSSDVLRRTGVRPLTQGILLWLLVSTTTLAAILSGLID